MSKNNPSTESAHRQVFTCAARSEVVNTFLDEHEARDHK